MRRLSHALLGCFASLYASSAFAGAWTQEKGKGLFITQATYFSTDEFFDAEGNLAPQDRYRKWELQPYLEYGATDWLTLGGTAYLQRVGQSGSHNHGLGDPELWARTRLWKGEDAVLSIQPLIKLPSRYVREDTPRGGSRATDMEFSVLYGESFVFLSHNDYLDTRIGYRWRGRDLQPQWRADVAYGTYLADDFQVVVAGRSVIAAQLDENALFREDGEQDYDLIKGEVTGIYHFDEGRWVHLTAYQHLGGFMVGAGRGISIGYAESF